MVYDESVLKNLNKFYDLKNNFDSQNIKDFCDILDNGIDDISYYLNIMINEYSINPFHNFENQSYSNQKEPVQILVNISNGKLFLDTEKASTIKNKKKRASIISVESIKFLLSIYLEKVLNTSTKILILPNSILVESVYEMGYNFEIFIACNNYINKERLFLLNSYSNKLIEFNYNEYMNNYFAKNSQTDGEFIKVFNIIKKIAISNGVFENMFALEGLLYNIPNEYFVKDSINNQLTKVLTCLRFMDFNSFKSIDNPTQLLRNNNFISFDTLFYKKELERLFKLFD